MKDNQIPFPSKPGAAKEPPMVHDWGLSSPVPVTEVHRAMQDIEAQGWDPMFALVAGAVRNPSLIANAGAPQAVPAVFIVFRSRTLRAYEGSTAPGFKVDNAPENGKGHT